MNHRNAAPSLPEAISPQHGATDANAARLLDAAIHSLRNDILPLLNDDAARIRCDHITRLLNNVAARLSKRADGLQQLVQAIATNADIAPATNPETGSLEQQRQTLERLMVERIPGWLDAAAADPTAVGALERIVAQEKTFFLSQDADIAAGSQVVYRGGRIDRETAPATADAWPPIDDANLSAYLRRHFGRETVKAARVRAIPGGFSKQTIFFTLIDTAANTETDLVIRKDMPVPFIDKTVANEFGVLQRLHALRFPVANPLWLEDDATQFGGRFIVSERVAGSSNAAQWAADPTRARNACIELARVLATLHAFEPQQLGYTREAAAISAGEVMEREIDHWTQLFHARKTEPLPLQELPLAWLRRNIPPALYRRPARVIHGDAGFHNLMFDDAGHVAALLDWEFSGLGDPTQDICFVRLFVDGIMEWREFLDIYRAAGGIEPCGDAEFFFDLWSKARNTIGCVDARALFDTVMPDEVKFALAGHVFAPYLYIDQCESLIAHLKKASR